jgi:hypothetical protein
MRNEVTLDIPVEELAASFPEAVGFLTKNGVRCIRCGEPVWGTLGELLETEGIENPQLLVDKLNAYLHRQKE